MAFISGTRLVNPRLGTYFGIFAAAFVALVLMALMIEQLGAVDILVRLIMFTGPLALYAGIAFGSVAREPREYFTCGRRVPAFFNGLVIGMAGLGGAAMLAMTGALFIVGFDALCLAIGWCAGLVFMAILIAPFLRKFGAFTVPGFLGRRFESRTLRLTAAAVLAVPILLLLAAEARFAAYASAWMLGQSERLMAVLVVVFVVVILFSGGMRALTWSSVAQAIAALLALAVPATIVALMLSNLPLPQMTHGNILRIVTRMEIAREVPTLLAPPLAVVLPGEGAEPLMKRFMQSFGSVGNLGFVLMSFLMAAGIAASPVLLPRSGTTPGVHETRKSLGWAVLVVGFVMLTLPAVAIYLRVMLLDQVVGQPGDRLPLWFQLLQQAGIARIDSKTQVLALSNIAFERDSILFALPIAAGFPQALIYLALAGALAASLAALGASLSSLAAIIAEDVVHGLPNETPPDSVRIGTARVALLGAGFVTTWLAIAAPTDPLELFLWGTSLTAAALFPVLVLSIWWDRINAWGAQAGMIVGFAVAVLTILLSEIGALNIPSVLGGAIAFPLAAGAAVVGSLMTPAPGQHLIDIINDTRVPGGETLHDREMRLLRLKSRP
jgi:cation/acetate symporter